LGLNSNIRLDSNGIVNPCHYRLSSRSILKIVNAHGVPALCGQPSGRSANTTAPSCDDQRFQYGFFSVVPSQVTIASVERDANVAGSFRATMELRETPSRLSISGNEQEAREHYS